jgi:hypothetical protein
MYDYFQWVACGLGMLGAVTNSVGGRLSRATWPFWLASNVLCLCALAHLGARGLVVQQVFYTFTTIVGGIRAFFPSAWSRFIRRCEVTGAGMAIAVRRAGAHLRVAVAERIGARN